MFGTPTCGGDVTQPTPVRLGPRAGSNVVVALSLPVLRNIPVGVLPQATSRPHLAGLTARELFAASDDATCIPSLSKGCWTGYRAARCANQELR